MKRLSLIIVAILCGSVFAKSQVKLQFGDDVTISPYVGMLSSTIFSVDSLHVDGFINVRLGATGLYQPTKWLGFTSRSVYQTNGFTKTIFNIDLQPISSLQVRIGSMATLTCFQRPDIVSAAGQFETWTESQIPGGAIGADARWKYQNGDIGVGVYDRNGLEYQGRVSFQKLTVSGSYNESEHWSMQASWSGNVLYTALVVQDTVVANISVVNIGSFSIYNDIGFYHQNDEMPRWEIGLLKNFAHEKYPASGLFGVGYAHETKSVMGYLFLHLTSKKKFL